MEMISVAELETLVVVAAVAAHDWTPPVTAAFAVESGAALAVAVVLSRFYNSFFAALRAISGPMSGFCSNNFLE